jgi:predicted alpha/beta-fold hydrolase
VDGVRYRRERIATPDADFLDLDWSAVGGDSLAVISHGLEGHSERAYVRGMVEAVNAAGIDALAWNFRGCGGEANRRLRLYHNGSTDDLHAVVTHAAATYRRIFLIGFSMGGNISLLYLGRREFRVPKAVKGCVVFSVPCDLTDASVALKRRENRIYMKRFLRLLHEKVRMKMALYPDRIDDRGYERLKTFKDFDERYTAPLHGFASAEDYWAQCSCRPWLKRIEVPTLIVNAMDDPFLEGGCYPVEECSENPQVTLEITRHGGHVGFVGRGGRYWSEERAVAFLRTVPEG